MKKRILAIVLALLMCLALLPASALAADSDFVIENGVLTGYKGPGGDVVIPDGVTGIGDRVFFDREVNSMDDVVTGVTIPNSVTSIGEMAFRGCNLASLTIPASVTSIGVMAFRGCGMQTAIQVDPGNKNYTLVDGILFTKDLKTIVAYPSGKEGAYTIPDSVTSINGAFADCYELTSVTIGKGVTSIEWETFGYCDGLTSVTIPGNVTDISGGAFAVCRNLTSIQVDPGNPKYTSLDGVLFEKDLKTLVEFPCGKKGTYVIPDSTTNIGYYSFYFCEDLTSITIPDHVVTIGPVAFMNCSRLASITIPNGVTEFALNMFLGCTSLKDVYYNGTEAQWKAIKIEEGNEPLASATIHYSNPAPDQPVAPDQPSNLPTVESIPATGIAVARTQTVKLDGKDVTFQCYAVKDANGNETNYVKLRDLAMALNGTKAQFNVGWNGKISITSNTPYQVKGSEGSTPYSGNQSYKAVSSTPVSFNGSDVKLTSFSITYQGGGYTYYKLRDLGQLLNFNVKWDSSCIIVESDKPYTG